MNPDPSPWFVSICTTDGASAAATAATGSVDELLVVTDGLVDTVAVVASAARTIVVLFPVARAIAKPLAASDTATRPARTGDRRGRGAEATGGARGLRRRRRRWCRCLGRLVT